ncbi:hypothetical protein MUTS15_56590 [Escherichia coli]|nr:hypothetical protein MUTS15_56590 [Escherichia coli]
MMLLITLPPKTYSGINTLISEEHTFLILTTLEYFICEVHPARNNKAITTLVIKFYPA